jgi:hypothetical protein
MWTHADCYAPTVETYFKMHNVPNERIPQYKRQAFSELLAIRRYDLSQVYISAPVDNRVFATFIKEWDTPTTSYAVYSGKETERLTFANIAGTWKIIREEERRNCRSSKSIATAIAALQQDNWVGEIGQGFTTVTVVVQQPPVKHEVKMNLSALRSLLTD